MNRSPEPGSVSPVSTEFRITRTDDAHGVVLAAFGQLDLRSAPQLQERLAEVLAEAHERVLLDLNGLTFVDSAGVSVLIRAKEEAERTGSRLVLRRPTEQLQRIFSVIGVVQWLESED